MVLSGAAHDIDHPGNNNLYEINTGSLLSLTYNDKSVLENYHLYVLFNLLNNPSLNIFNALDEQTRKNIRKMFINNIIATDFAMHAPDLMKLKNLINNNNNEPESKEYYEYLRQDNTKQTIFSQLVHFADISNSTKKFHIYNKWVDCLFNEFYAQGDKEKALKIPVSMLCDREKTNIPASQIFFMNAFIKDHIICFSNAFEGFTELLNILDENKAQWEIIKKKAEKEKEKASDSVLIE